MGNWFRHVLRRLIAWAGQPDAEYHSFPGSRVDPPSAVAFDEPVPNTRLAIDSADTWFPFEVDLEVRHTVEARHAVPRDPFRIAQCGIRRRAEAIGGRLPLTRAADLRADLETALYQPAEVDGTGVVAWVSCVDVRTDPTLVEIVTLCDQLRRRDLARRWQHESQEAEITRLTGRITDPVRATAWWFTQHPEEVGGLVDTARLFNALRAELSPSEGAPPEPDNWFTVLAEFGQEADSAARYMFGHQAARVFEAHGRTDLAQRVRRLTDLSHVGANGSESKVAASDPG